MARPNPSVEASGSLPVGEALRLIYDSASDPAVWHEALDVLATATGCAGAIVAVSDLTDKADADGHAYEVSACSRLIRDNEAKVEEYYRRFADYERTELEVLRTAPCRQPLSDSLAWPNLLAVRNRADYRFRREHLGVYRRVAARLNDNRRWLDLVLFQLDAKYDRVPIEISASIAGFLPHIAKSVELGRTLSELRRRFDAVLSMLDHVKIGLCLVQFDGTVTYANQEARRMIDESPDLTLASDGSLAFAEPENATRVRRAIEAVTRTAGGAQDVCELRTRSGRRVDGQSLMIEIAPVRDRLKELGEPGEHALVTLIDPGRTGHISTQRLSIAYRLSASESEVCRMLVAGHTLIEIAEIRGVGLETVKTQSRSVSSKTGVASRVELIRLAVGSSPPIAD